MTKKERERIFAAEIYLAASFFKMKTIGSKGLDAKINRESGANRPFADTNVEKKHVSCPEKMPKFFPAKYVAPTLIYVPPEPITNLGELKLMTKIANPILETVQIENRFFIRLPGVKWWQYSYETKDRADRCRQILQDSWDEPGEMERDLVANFKDDLKAVVPASV